MYFWATLAVLFVLACAMGWRMDRKRKGAVRGRARESVDARGIETLMRHNNPGGPTGGMGL